MVQNLIRRGALACLILGGAVAPLPLMAQESGADANFSYVFENGNALLDKCRMSDAYAQGYCLAFAVAASDAVSAHVDIFGWRACVPKSVTREQDRDILVAFLVAHPEKRHFGAIGLAAQALSITFPCPAAQ